MVIMVLEGGQESLRGFELLTDRREFNARHWQMQYLYCR